MSSNKKLTDQRIASILEDDLSDIETETDEDDSNVEPDFIQDLDINDAVYKGLQNLFGYEPELVDITLAPPRQLLDEPESEVSVVEPYENEPELVDITMRPPRQLLEEPEPEESMIEPYENEPEFLDINALLPENPMENQGPEANNVVTESLELTNNESISNIVQNTVSQVSSSSNISGLSQPQEQVATVIHLASEWSEKLPEHMVPVFDTPMSPIKSYTHKTPPLDYFQNFFPESIYDIMVKQSNIYAAQKQSRNWTPSNKGEISAFLGVLIMMGLHPLPDFNLYWSTDPFYRNPDIASTFTSKRFKKLLENFHLNDNSEEPLRDSPDHDKLYKIRPLITIFNQVFQNECTQSTNQSIDECMVKFKGKSTLKQYMPKKPIKRGYKIWARCDAKTGYIYSFDIYIGKSDVNASMEEGLGYNVVMKLCNGVPRNTLLAFDNFFTGIPLSRDLLTQNGIYSVGTVRLNRKGLPKEVLPKNKTKNEKLAKHEFMYLTKSPVSVVQWMDTKIVTVVTTAHDPKSLTTVKRTQKDGSKLEIQIPTAIAQYTLNMGGVDKFDHYRASYPIGRKSRRNWFRLFYFMFDAAVINFYLTYIHVHKQKVHTHREYRLRLARSLVDGFTTKKKTTEIFKNKRGGQFGVPEEIRLSSLPHYPEDQKKFTRCRFCSTKQKQKRSRIICHVCHVALCAAPCFKNFHAASSEDIEDMEISIASGSGTS